MSASSQPRAPFWAEITVVNHRENRVDPAESDALVALLQRFAIFEFNHCLN
ncbi:hypothetical protein [Ralstonia sp. 25mfcol4.1]|uniref:hypothetical protein n=1 Tax=Ralstonia sp. 25mfcol4.1 TaxID=1761899 RepID=UPI001587CA95|nr:hypothetical protein [Ralstonia sp. 25mfcol4.1]